MKRSASRPKPVEGHPGVYELEFYFDDMDYCDAKTEEWIWMIRDELSTRKLFAYTFAAMQVEKSSPGFMTVWLR